jgi:aldose 1-epimerase
LWDRDDNLVARHRQRAACRVWSTAPGAGTKNALQRAMNRAACHVSLMLAFGRADDRRVTVYILRNPRGLEAWITNYGATLVALHVPDRYGRRADVVLGFDRVTDYIAPHPAIGAVVGRVANRIAGAQFTLDDTTYALAANDGAHHLHGGWCGLGRVVWDAACVRTADGPAVELRHRSADGAGGYPGNLDVVVLYTLTDANELRIAMTARTDRPTPVNLAHHAYWNLAGHEAGTILDHELQIAADAYTPVDAERIPTGAIETVAGTAFDFRVPRPIARGYDHNFVLPGGGHRFVARAKDPASGRAMEVWTDQPGLQLYTGDALDGSLVGKAGVAYGRHQGFCLETQGFPDAVHHPDWPSVVVRPGHTYHHQTVHKLFAE